MEVCNRIVQCWNSLPATPTDFSSLTCFRSLLRRTDLSRFRIGKDRCCVIFNLVHLSEFGILNMERLMSLLIQCVIHTSVSVQLNLGMFSFVCVFYSSMFVLSIFMFLYCICTLY